ncbi:hypothetical protein H2199_009204 [Coniosporium tulheliwenetii]|uniref:Uncharacterized protein n=1 Tax=Coniosporium tulheliwenetii TaxID=3383036 RepID=A0ACC2YFL2_9PEZI|nr:hypothetical protein H2199_009204 [Cladosporium sp. JES 115]
MEKEQGVPVVATPAATPSATPQGKLTSRKRGRPAGSTIEAKRSSKRIAVTIKPNSQPSLGSPTRPGNRAKKAAEASGADESGHAVNERTLEANPSATDTTTAIPHPGPRPPRLPTTGRADDRTATGSSRESPARASSGTRYISPYTRAEGNGQSRQAAPATTPQQVHERDAASLEPKDGQGLGENSSVDLRHGSQSTAHGTSAGELSDKNPNASRAPSRLQPLPSPSASGEALDQNSNPNHRVINHAEGLPQADDGKNGDYSHNPSTNHQDTAVMGNGAGAYGAPQRLAVSSAQHAALPAQAVAARQDTNTGKPDEVNEADGVGNHAQSQLGSAEDDLARQLGLKVLEYQRYQKLVSQAIRQRDEHWARVQGHEKRIAMEQATLHGLREQLQLLQDNIKETKRRVDELSDALPHERAVEQTARSQTENIEKQMVELRRQLGF